MNVRAKTIGRVFAWIFGGMLLVLCLTVAGALLWLRTDHGEKTVASLAVDALAKQGLFLAMDEFSGPLPFHLLLRNARIADAGGEWFSAKELELALSPGDLLHTTVTVSLLRADTPTVYRLPQLPPSEPTGPEPEPSPGYFSLPVGVKLENLTVTDLGIAAPLVFPETAGTGEKGPHPPALFRASFQGTAAAAAGQPLQAAVTAQAAVADMPGLWKNLGMAPLPVTGLSLALETDATVGAMIDATVKGTITPEEDGRKHPLTCALHAQLAGEKAALQSLSLEGAGLDVNARGGANLKTLAVQAEADIRARSGGEWETLLARVSGQNLGGSLHAAFKGTVAQDASITASATLSGTDMRWGMEQVQQLLGTRFEILADASGGGEKPFHLRLGKLEAGAVSVSGEGSFLPADTSISATVNAALASLAPVAEGVSGSLKARATVSGSLAAPAGTLEATSDAVQAMGISLENLRAAASFSGTPQAPAATIDATLGTIRHDSGIVEDIRILGNLSGTLEAPAASLEATTALVKTNAATLEKVRATGVLSGTLADPVFALTTTGASIKTTAGVFGNVRLGLDGKAALPQKGDQTVQARLDAAFQSSPAGPVTLKTDLAASRNHAGAITARLSGLDLSLAGTELAADITAAIPAPQTGGKAAPLPSIRGTASADISDWKPVAALTGVPITGKKAGFDATFTHDAAIQHISATIRADALTLPDTFSVSGLSGSLEAHDLANPDISLTLGMGKGRAGPVDWETGAATVSATKGNGSFAVALRTDKTARDALGAIGPIGPIGKGAPAEPGATERLSAAGSFALAPMQLTLDRLAARMPESPLGVYLTAPATVELGDATRVQGLRLNMIPGKGAVAVDASLHGNTADLTATVSDLVFQPLRDAFGVPLPDGSLSAEAVLKKNGASVQGAVKARASVIAPVAGARKTPPVLFVLAGTLDRQPDPRFPELRSGGGVSRLKGDVTVGFDGQTDPSAKPASPARPAGAAVPAGTAPDAKIHFNVPLTFAANGVPEPAMAAPLRANVAWKGEIAPLWALAPMQDRTLSGLAQIDADLKGTLQKPEYSLGAYVAGGRFEDHILGVLLSAITVEASSTSAGESTLLMRAEDGAGGYVALDGHLTLPQPTAAGAPGVPTVRARGHINHLQPLHRDDIFLRLSGRLAVDGPLNAMKVGAEVEVERGEIAIQHLAGSVRTLEITDPDAKQEPASAGPVLDVKVSIPNRFYIRGRGLDSEWEGDLAVAGTAGAPSLTGSLRPVRGTFDLLSKPFAFSEGDISFMGGDRIDPGLNLALTYDGPNITAIVRATGRASKPEITMESQPSRPQDQIMADVLFGKEFSELSRFESLQVANSLRQLANIGGDGLDPLATMRTQLGIDMLRVGSSGGENRDNRSISGAPGADAVGGGSSSGSGGSGGGGDSASTPTLEAGKYINDAIYVGVEQGATADSTGVRVEVELRPNLNLQGKTSTRSSEVGIGWKKDY